MTNSSPDLPQNLRQKRRHFNMAGVKGAIIFVSSAFIGMGSAVSGLAPQTAVAPMLAWMLGFSPEKSIGTASMLATITSAASAIAILSRTTPSLIVGDVGRAALLAVAGLVGAILCAGLRPKAEQLGRKRFGLVSGIVVAVFTIGTVSHQGGFNSHIVRPIDLLPLAGLGLAVGALTQVLALAGGILMVAALYFIAQFSASDSLAISLLVISIASLVPSLSYWRSGFIDARFSTSAIIGGVLGGVIGGKEASLAADRALLSTYGLFAVFLCARELYRINMDSLPTGTSGTPGTPVQT